MLMDKIQELDMFKQPLIVEAVGNDDGDLAKVLIEFAKADNIDDKLWCHTKFIDALNKYFKLDAEEELFNEAYEVIQVAVDDFKVVERV